MTNSPLPPARDERGDYRLFMALLVLIAWLPLPLGSARPWAWAMMEIGSFIILFIWLAKHWSREFQHSPALGFSRAPLIILSAWLIFTLLQSIPLPPAALQAVSPASGALRGFNLEGYASGWAPMSVDQGASMAEFMKNLSYTAIFILVLVLADSPGRLKALALVMTFVGFAEALYGLISVFTGLEYVWWIPKTQYRGFVTGTFINRNHLAGCLEMAIPLGLGLLLAGQPDLAGAPNFRAKARMAISSLLDNWGLLAVGVLIMFAGLFLTASRGGVGSIFAAFLLVCLAAKLIGASKGSESSLAPFLFGLAIAAALWLGLGRLPERFESSSFSMESRPELWRQSLRIFWDYPIFGSGAGTFQHLLPLYDSGSSPLYFDHAHNDFVETLADQGIAGFSLLGSAVALLIFRIFQGLKKRRDPLMRGLLFASLTGSASILLHSFVDFNFHIPANAAHFFVLLGIGAAASTVPSR